MSAFGDAPSGAISFQKKKQNAALVLSPIQMSILIIFGPLSIFISESKEIESTKMLIHHEDDHLFLTILVTISAVRRQGPIPPIVHSSFLRLDAKFIFCPP
jgi:hypothetical protein